MLPAADPLPHRHPFRFVDLRPDGARVRLTTGPLLRGEAPLPAVYAVEIIAQAAICIQAAEAADDAAPAGEIRYLAGVDSARFDEALARRPFAVGDELEVALEMRGGFGRLSKLRGTLARAGAVVAEADLVLVTPPGDG